MVHQLPLTADTFESLKELKLQATEVAMFCKFVLLKQQTLTSGQASTKISEAPAVLLLGDKEQVKAQLSQWLDEAMKAYHNV